MSSKEQEPSQSVYRYVECQCPAELLPAAVNPSLRAIFTLSTAAVADTVELQPYGAEAYKVNMPPLWASSQRGELARALANPEERLIVNRARQIVAAPYLHENPAEIDDRELLHIQAWLEGLVHGETEQRIAGRLGASPKHIVTAGGWLRTRLGAGNQPNAMYGALLHGFMPDMSATPAHQAPVSHYERLHFYLTALGFKAWQAAKLTRPDSGEWYADTVSSARGKIVRDFGAASSAQAVFFAFETGHFRHLS